MEHNLIAEFVAITQSDPDTAAFYLNSCNNELKSAIDLYYSSNNNQPIDLVQDNASTEEVASTSQPKISKFKTINDIDVHNTDNQQYYAGGKNSGMMIETPKERDESTEGSSKLLEQIIEKARQTVQQGQTNESSEGGSVVSRELVLWSNGLSVEDNFVSYGTPEGQEYLKLIKEGVAPRKLLNVKEGEKVEVKVVQKTDEDYQKPKPSLKPFSGTGQRLGNVTPQIYKDSSINAQPTQKENNEITNEIDSSLPTTTLQIRFANGQRKAVKFNTTQTVGHLRQHIQSITSMLDQNSFDLIVYPNRRLSDDNLTLEEAKVLNSAITIKHHQ